MSCRCHGQQPGGLAAVVRYQVQPVRRQHTRPDQQNTEKELRPGQRAPADAHAHGHQEEGHGRAKTQEQEQSRVQRKVNNNNDNIMMVKNVASIIRNAIPANRSKRIDSLLTSCIDSQGVRSYKFPWDVECSLAVSSNFFLQRASRGLVGGDHPALSSKNPNIHRQ